MRIESARSDHRRPHRHVVSRSVLVKWGLKVYQVKCEFCGFLVSRSVLVKWGLKVFHGPLLQGLWHRFKKRPRKMRIESGLPRPRGVEGSGFKKRPRKMRIESQMGLIKNYLINVSRSVLVKWGLKDRPAGPRIGGDVCFKKRPRKMRIESRGLGGHYIIIHSFKKRPRKMRIESDDQRHDGNNDLRFKKRPRKMRIESLYGGRFGGDDRRFKKRPRKMRIESD